MKINDFPRPSRWPVRCRSGLFLLSAVIALLGTSAALAAPVSLWPGNPTPAITSVTDDTAEVELGLKFQSSTNGYVTGVRFYKGTNNLGTHVGSLWTTNGLLLGTAVFANETATGWQQQDFSSAIPISSNVTYIISYRAPQGGYAVNTGYFTTSGVTNGPLRAPPTGAVGGNGVYRYGEGAFPNLTFNAANYWADVIFDTVVPVDTNQPIVATVSPAAAQTNVATSVTLSITFSEPMLASTINTTNIFLKDATNGTIPATVTLTGSPLIATLTPLSPLPANTNFTATVKGGVTGVADLATNRMAADYSWSFSTAPGDIVAPTVSSFSPGSGITKVSIATAVTVTFSEPMLASTITNTTIVLRDSLNALVPASVSFDAVNRRATLTPSNLLASASNYTAYVYGGSSGVKDLANNPMSGTNSWTFTTVPAHPYGPGPGGSVLLLTQATNRMSFYLAEILLTEGLNQFAIRDITALNATMITNFNVVIVGNIPLTAGQTTTLSNWVVNGGSLIAMRPDNRLSGLLGLTNLGTTLSEGYLGVNTSTAPGQGIVGTTMQYHGTANLYALNGATSVATLYSSSTTATTNPAVTWRNFGANGGRAACFTYDLARSVALTRQGNPAWAGQERDGFGPLRAGDMFYGPSSSDPQPNWVDLSRVAIPQADEQQRLLVNLVHFLGTPKKPLPRFWYFPDGHKAVIVMTGDDHANAATAGRFDQYLAASPTNAVVTNWQAVRSSSYIYPNTAISSNAALSYHTNGFEIGLHISSFCENYNREQMEGYWNTQLGQFAANFPGLPLPATYRNHCIAWSGYTLTPEIASHFGLRFDVNYYFWPPGWVQNTPGVFTGSGMPMRFAAPDGSVLDVFQAPTQMTDESGQTYPFTSNTLLDRALDTNGFYGAYVANMHTDLNPLPESDAIVASAQARGVPIVSAQQMLTWLDGRNASYFTNVVWTNKALSFTVSAPAAARGLKTLIPVPDGHLLVNVRSNGVIIAAASELVKGVSYVTFPAASAGYLVTFATDTTPPTVTTLTPTNGASFVGTTTPVTVVFNEAMLASTINTNTVRLLNNAAAVVPAQLSYNPSTFTVTLQPDSPLALSQSYTSVVVSGGFGVKDLATNALAVDATSAFTTTDVQTFSVWNNGTTPANITSTETNANELGMKFRTLTNGFVTGLRFYKGPANTGLHVGNLWSAGGSLLATLTFTNETASGWQQQDFPAPFAILSNTTYVISYHSPVGGYSFDSGYFSSGSITNDPLVALGNGVDGANAVFKPGATGFPNLSTAGVNFWVDPVFVYSLGPDTNAPAVVAVTPLNGATNVTLNTAVTVTFDEPMDPATINATNFMLVSGSVGGVELDAISTGSAAETGSAPAISQLNIAHTTTNGLNRLMLVGASFEDDGSPSPGDFGITNIQWIVGSVTQSLTRLARQDSPLEAIGEIWSLVNPTNGTGTVRVITTNAGPDGDALVVGVATFVGVHQAIPLGTAVTNSGTGAAASVVVNSAVGELVFDVLALDDARSASADAGQTGLWSFIAGTVNADGIRGGASLKPGAASVTNSWTMTSDTWAQCAVAIKPAVSGTAVPASVTYNPITFTATLQPSNALALNQPYTAIVKGGGVTDLSTNALASDYQWSFTTTPEELFNLWGNTNPAVASFSDPNPYELGMKFRSLSDGFIKGVRFYKGASNTGTHTGNLWLLGNTNPLDTVTFTGETASGWQEQNFDVPVAISSNTTYIISYHTTAGNYALNAGGFNGGSVTNFPLIALGNGVDGNNGVFNPGAASTYPGTGSGGGNNYWVDAIYTASVGPDTNAPLVESVSPLAGATNVSIASAVSVTFNEAMLASSITTNSFRLVDAATNLVPAALSYNPGTRTATLQPSNTLTFGQTYTATVLGGTNGVKDLATNALAGSFAWSFTTPPPDLTPPTVVSVNPTNSAANVALNSAISLGFSEAMTAGTITTNTVRLLDPSSNAVPVTLTYNATNFTVTLQPSNSLTPGQTYTVRVTGGGLGVKDLAGNALAADFTSQFTATPDIDYTIWPSFTVPANITFDPGDTNNPYEFGVKFLSQADGYIKGVRFYKGPANNGTHYGSLWTTNGTRLAFATFSNETASGWQQVDFSSPVQVASNTTYVASYFSPAGGYSLDRTNEAGGLLVGVTNLPLIALANSLTPNGVFAGSAGTGTNASIFPTISGNGANYWVDVVFQPLTNAAPIVANPIPNQSGGYGTNFTYTFPTNTFNDPEGGVLSYSASGLPTGVTFTPATRSFAGAPAQTGIYPVNVVATDNGAPIRSATNTFTLTVVQRALSITAVNTNKVYGSALQPVLYTVAGLTNSDSVTNLTLTSGGSPTNATIGSYSIIPSNALGVGLTNYSISYSNGTMTVGVANLLITAANTNKVYGAALQPTLYTVTGLVNGNTVTNVTLTSAGSPTNATIGSYAIVPSSPLGLGLTNYSVTLSNGTLTVGTANLLITAANTNKVYGTALQPTLYTVAGLLNSDSVTNVTLTSAGSATNATLGTYPIAATDALGAGLTNYTLAYSNGTLTVNAASLLIVAGNTNKTYGTALQPTLYTVVGLTNSDNVTNVTLISAGSPTNATVGSYAIVPGSPLGLGLTNYSVTLSNGTLTVGAANLLITAADTNKVYGTALQPTLYTVAGLLNSDSVTNVTLTSAGSATNATLGTYPIAATDALGAGLTNYTLAYSNGTLTVNAASLLIVAGNTNKTYGTALQPTLYTVVGLTNSDSVTNVTLTSAGSPTNATIGSYAIVPGSPLGLGLTNYSVTLSNGTMTVGAANLLITAANTNKVYGTALQPTLYAVTGLLNSDSVTNVTLASAGSATNATLGTYPITATDALGAGLTNYTLAYSNGTLTVNAASLLIVAGNTNKTYGTELLPTSYTVVGLTNSDSVTNVTLTSAGSPTNATIGSYAIVPSSPLGLGLTNYSVTLSNGTLTVDAASLLISALSTNKEVGQTIVFAGTEFSTTGLVAGDAVTNATLGSAGAGAAAAAGSYPITITNALGTGLTNYSVTYSNGTLTVTNAPFQFIITSITAADGVATVRWNSISNQSYRLLYKDDLLAPVWSVVPGDVVAPSNSTSHTNVLGAAAMRYYRVQQISNSAPTLPLITNQATAELATLVITNAAADADLPAELLTYALLAAPTNAVIGTTTGVISWTPDEQQGPSTNEFIVKVTDNGGLSATNSFTVIVAEVNAAPVVQNPIPNQAGEYASGFSYQFPSDTFSDVDSTALTYSASGLPGGIGFTPATRTLAGAPTNTGLFSITVIATDDGVPALSATNVFTLNIGLRPLVIAAANTNKIYGASLVPLAFTAIGLTNSDSITNLTLTSAGSPTNATIGSYAIVPGSPLGLGLTNYSVTLSNGTLTVGAANLLITAANTNKVYGAALLPTSYTVAGLLNSDTVTNVTLTSAGSATNATIGMYQIAATDALGAGLTNYTLAYSNGTLTVNAASLLIVAGNTNKTYGTELLPTSYTVVGLTNGDSVTNVTLTSAGSPTNATIGSYAIVPGSPLGLGLTNYSVTLSNGTLTVGTANLLITAANTNKVYGTALQPTLYTVTGLLNSDSVTNVTLASAGSATNATLGTYPIAATDALGAGLTNYTLAYSNGTLTVNAASLLIVAGNTNKTYGTELLPTSYTVVGLTNGDSVTNVTLTSAGSPTNATIGSYAIVPGSPLGLGLTNYSVTLSNGTLTVGTANLLITAANTNKVYGTALQPTLYTVTGLLNSDSVTNVTLASAGSATNATLGTYPIAATDALGAGLTNYTLAYSNGTMTVDAASLLIVAVNTNKVYGTELLPTLYTVVGLTNSDSITNLTLTSAGSPTNATIGSYATVPADLLGVGLTNYSVTLSNGTLTVGPAALTITALDTNKNFGDTLTFAGTEFLTAGLQNSDVVDSATLTSAGAAAGATAGVYPIGITNAVGSGLGNYTIVYVTGSLTVAPPPAFSITSITASNGIATVTWQSVSNISYTLEYRTNLLQTNWVSVLPPVVATGTSASQTNAVGADEQRFYRVQATW